MTNPAKAKGSRWELDVARYFNSRGMARVERRYGAGNNLDKGDINGVPGVAIECKALKSITLSTIMDETEVEKANAHADYGLAIIKRRGKGPEKAYAVMTLEDLVSLLLEAKRC